MTEKELLESVAEAKRFIKAARKFIDELESTNVNEFGYESDGAIGKVVREFKKRFPKHD